MRGGYPGLFGCKVIIIGKQRFQKTDRMHARLNIQNLLNLPGKPVAGLGISLFMIQIHNAFDRVDIPVCEL